MRTWGRNAQKQWVEVDTDENGFNDNVYLTTLCQVLKLNLGESPFYANWGIPVYQSLATQVYPDIYLAMIQNRFATFFKALTITRNQQSINPIYQVNVVCHSGATMSAEVVL